MTDLTISMPPALEDWVRTRLTSGEYSDAADYLRDLVRRDRAELGRRDHLRALIEEGIASGLDEREPKDIIASILAEDPDFCD